jgi:hypothetical protein
MVEKKELPHQKRDRERAAKIIAGILASQVSSIEIKKLIR